MAKTKGATNAGTPARKRAVIEALQCADSISSALEVCGVAYTTHVQWYRADAKYRAAVEASRVKLAELAMQTLWMVMTAGEDEKSRVSAAAHVLRYAGKYAGLTPKEELEHSGEETVIKLTFDERTREEVNGERD